MPDEPDIPPSPPTEDSPEGNDSPAEPPRETGATERHAERDAAPEATPASTAADPPAEDFAALLASSESAGGATEISVGELTRGRVVAIGRTTAFVAIGAKGEAEIDLAEFRDPDSGDLTIAVGDTIEASVVDDGSSSGSIVLKQTLGRGSHVPAELEQAHEHGIAVEGVVTAENKGGFEIQLGNVRAFCPGSQIDVRRGERRSSEEYIGQRLQFRVTRIDGGGRNVVVSRRQLLEEEARELAAETWKRLQVGATVSGTVTSIRDFGAFVDLGGVDGLIHITEMGYGRVEHPSDMLQEGQRVETQVLRIAEPGQPEGKRQIALSLKALAVDPWKTPTERFRVGSTVRGTVRRLESFGAFVELAPGLDGLVHVSKIVLDRRLSHPRQALHTGEEVDVTILSVDPKARRMSLSMIEKARDARDAAEAHEQAEEKDLLAKQNAPASLGTLADLLAGGKKHK